MNMYTAKIVWLDNYERVKDVGLIALCGNSAKADITSLYKSCISKSKCHSSLRYIWCSIDDDLHYSLIRDCSPADTSSTTKSRLVKYLRACKKSIHITVCRECSKTLITVEKVQ